MTVLVTGGAGYIGSMLVRQLLRAGHRVRVADTLQAGGESIIDLLDVDDFEFVRSDVRDEDAMREAAAGVDAIVHLAAIVGDPACAEAPELARNINLDASKQLYRIAEDLGIGKFVFASTCSNYGKMEGEDFLDEDSPLRPVSLYAETKVEVEKYLLDQPDGNDCKPTCLRFATVYGLSPRVRFDLTVNQFTKELALGKELVIYGEQFWRPYCHVADLARSVRTVLNAEADDVAFDVFNVGDNDENYQKQTIVDLIVERIPDADLSYVEKTEDPRDYRVDFSKIHDRLGFEITRTVPDGIDEIKYIIENGFIQDPEDERYYNIDPKEVSA
ncbi:NAD-dependent epimerase/dehydratase family protein [Salinibacter ruber]|uniref:NAD-dependent epimerase/dehydratase family protein n=1 Tax=Salinibacter ruber TaxID=146919 RepID=UPI00216A6CDD|nr:NAD(P)-dependent oxidoreductase [Salinibacter ruber]MCS4174468.1 nucleoside-diphosphate-sugar epimerase [Salinibacter ruber]